MKRLFGNAFRAISPPTEQEYKRAMPLSGIRPKKILLLDDDMNDCNFVREVAERFYVDLVIVHTIREALELVRDCIGCSAQKNFDGMILDVRITNGSGIDLYRYVSEQLPKTQVVFLTGYDSEDYRRQIEEVGPARVYAKSKAMAPEFLSQLFQQLGAIERNEEPSI